MPYSNLETGNIFLEKCDTFVRVENWSFLTNHARVLLRITQDPDARLRDIAASLEITERSAYSIVTDLTAAGYVVKHKDGRRNRYQVQAHLPLPDVLAALDGETPLALR
jgi:DNA-binding MarR family transcriptional regulator